MEKLDLSSQSRSIQDAYEKVVRGTPGTSYVVYLVNKLLTVEVAATGDGSLDEFVENFSDGQVQFGLARVSVPGSDVFKNLLVGWCPDNAPTKSRLSFASNFADVARVLSGYHVQITARDQDDLDVDDFMARVRAAAGAGYSGGSTAKPSVRPEKSEKLPTPKPADSALTLNKSDPSKKPAVAKPIVSKPAPKPVSAKPSFVPKSTGKPVGIGAGSLPSAFKPIVPKPAAPKPKNDDDGWGDAQEIKERDFESEPLESVPSAYKPTKVDINELRKQKSDTISSQPKKASLNTSSEASDKGVDSHAGPTSLSDRMKSYQDNLDGRLSSLPKPKVSHSVASRYHPTELGAPAFGSKPSFGNPLINKNDKIVGGVSKNFAMEGGKTPTQLWAEKHGKSGNLEDKFSKASLDDDPSQEEPADAPEAEPEADKEEEPEPEEEPEEEEKPATPARGLPPAPARGLPPAPARNLPPPPARNTPSQKEPEAEEDEEEEQQEEEAPPTLPGRSLPPPPQQSEPAAPLLPSRSEPAPAANNISAVAEYDYEKEEDNELGFNEGDLIVEIELVDPEWWSGKHSKTGEVGLFPATYVKRVENGDSEATPATASETKSEPAKSGPSAVAEYKYEKDEDNEIGFDEGDLIVEIDFVDEDWWSGKHLVTGAVGLFPANYVALQE